MAYVNLKLKSQNKICTSLTYFDIYYAERVNYNFIY